MSQVLLRSGELAPQGFPVVTLLDMSDAWAQFHVREDLLPRFPVGTEFDARIPGLGDQTVRFKVTHVAVMGDFATCYRYPSGFRHEELPGGGSPAATG